MATRARQVVAAAVLGTALLVTSCADAFSGIKETALAISTDGRTRLDAILLPCQSGRVAKTGLIELFMNEPTVTSSDRTALRPTTTYRAAGPTAIPDRFSLLEPPPGFVVAGVPVDLASATVHDGELEVFVMHWGNAALPNAELTEHPNEVFFHDHWYPTVEAARKVAC